MALCSQIIDLIRTYFSDDPHQAGGIRQIPSVKNNFILPDQMIDTSCVTDGGSADQSVHLISFFQKELCQIGAVLSGNSCN